MYVAIILVTNNLMQTSSKSSWVSQSPVTQDLIPPSRKELKLEQAPQIPCWDLVGQNSS